MKNSIPHQKKELFITCSHGLENLLLEELQDLGFDKITPAYRGVYVSDSSMEAIYKINYCSRIATRVLLPISRFRCFDKKSLYQNAFRIDWLKYLSKGKTFAIDANVSHKNLKNSLFASQVVKDAITDQFREKTGARPSVNVASPDVQLNLFIHGEFATISFDTSGTPLYKRGYRQETVEAPIQESIAAALLKIAKVDQENGVVYDPCCGSGTFLIESALIKTNTAPGFLRKSWGFFHLPEFSEVEWLKVKNKTDEKRRPLPKGMLLGTDNNKNSCRVSKANLRAAGFHQEIEIKHVDFQEFIPESPVHMLIANPPHGNRLGEAELLKKLYRSFGSWIKEHMKNHAKAFIFTTSLDLAKEVGLAASRRHILEMSGTESRFLEFDVY